MQNQIPLVSVPIAGAVPASAVQPVGSQPPVPADPTASMQMAAMPIQQQPGSPQALSHPGVPMQQPNGQQAYPPNGQQAYPPNGQQAYPQPGQMMFPPQQNGGFQMPQPAQYYQQAPPMMALSPAPAPSQVQPIPITAENLAALGYVPGPPRPAAQQPAAQQPAAQQPAAQQPAAQQPAPATPPSTQVPNGQPNGQPNGAPPALDIVRSDKPEVQALLNKQRDQLTQAYEHAQQRANMAETERLRAERQDAINLANQHAAAATQARQSYELASALMNSGQQLQPNAQAIVEAQVGPLLAQGFPAQQALAHVLQSHPYLVQAPVAQQQPGTGDAQILGIADSPPSAQPPQGYKPQHFSPQGQQMPQAPMFGQPVQAVFQQPTTGFLGQPMTQMGGQHPVPPAQPGEVDLRGMSSKDFRDWKLANGIHS